METPLRGLRRVTHRDPLSPNILNMVVDAIIKHWVIVVAGEEASPYGFRCDIKWLAMFFYADDGILDSLRLARLQADLGLLAGIFEKLSLHTNANNTVGMV